MTGYNVYGKLGLGNTTTVTTATSASSNAWLNNDTTYRIVEILELGRYFNGGWVNVGGMTMLLKNATQTRIVSTGWNDFGAIGDGTITTRNVPTVPTGTWNTVKQIWRKGGGVGDTYVLKDDGTVWGWGTNQQGSLGLGNLTQQSTPVQIQTGVTNIFGGMASTWLYSYQMTSPLLEKADGYHVCGFNANGEGGVRVTTNPLTSWTRVALPLSMRLKYLGETSTSNQNLTRFAVTTNDELYVWGYNGHGMIEPGGGNGWQPMRFIPSILVR